MQKEFDNKIVKFLSSYVNNNNKEKNRECCEPNYADCIVASKEACDAPEITKLVNTVYTTIPNFNFPQNGALVNISSNLEYTFNYYIKLPCESCEEIRMLWPLTWMVPQIIKKLTGFTGTGIVTIILQLNVISKKLIKDPAQVTPTLNTGGIVNGICICDSSSPATYDYTFNLAFASSELGPSVLSTTSPSTLTFSAPNNPVVAQFAIDPNTLNLIPQTQQSFINFIAASIGIIFIQFFLVDLDEIVPLLALLGISNPTLTNIIDNSTGVPTVSVNGTLIVITGNPSTLGSYSIVTPGIFPATSPAHYVSFVSSCGKNSNNNYWVATNIETSRV